MTGRHALETYAPTAVAAFDAVASIPGPDLYDAVLREFSEQFALDVSALDGAQRSMFLEATGADAFAVVQRVYAADVVPRVSAVLDAVFGPGVWPAGPSYEGETWPILEEFMVAVARLDSLDATTTELVRLRGARLHDCAVCKSRRSQDAIASGADEDTFAAVDSYNSSNLPASTKAALALTDSMIWAPYDVRSEVVTEALDKLTPAQILEVVLDVMRNAANKIAVALGADGATVTEGVELFTTDADGNLSVVGTAASV